MTLLTADELGEVLERTRRDLFRIETLPSYDTAMTTGDFRRWLAGEAEPTWVGEIKLRVDSGYFAVDVAATAHREGVTFALGAKRLGALWALLGGISQTDWTEATCMPGAQIAVAHYRPGLVAAHGRNRLPKPARHIVGGERSTGALPAHQPGTTLRTALFVEGVRCHDDRSPLDRP